MPGVTIVPADQRVPAHYLNRKFAIHFNLPKLGKLADPAKSFPALGRENALALAVLALVRLRTAGLGVAQANDGVIAGSVAAWAAEQTAARADADAALHAVRAAFPEFETGQRVFDAIKAFSTDAAKSVAYAPSQLPTNWKTAANVAPTSVAINTTNALNAAINKNFKTLANVADADSDVVTMTEFCGNAIPAGGQTTKTVNGVLLTATSAGVVTGPAQSAGKTLNGTFTFSDDEGGAGVQRAFTIVIS